MLVLDVSQPVGEVNHGAVGKLDVELLVVEVDVKLRKHSFSSFQTMKRKENM